MCPLPSSHPVETTGPSQHSLPLTFSTQCSGQTLPVMELQPECWTLSVHCLFQFSQLPISKVMFPFYHEEAKVPEIKPPPPKHSAVEPGLKSTLSSNLESMREMIPLQWPLGAPQCFWKCTLPLFSYHAINTRAWLLQITLIRIRVSPFPTPKPTIHPPLL